MPHDNSFYSAYATAMRIQNPLSVCLMIAPSTLHMRLQWGLCVLGVCCFFIKTEDRSLSAMASFHYLHLITLLLCYATEFSAISVSELQQMIRDLWRGTKVSFSKYWQIHPLEMVFNVLPACYIMFVTYSIFARWFVKRILPEDLLRATCFTDVHNFFSVIGDLSGSCMSVAVLWTSVPKPSIFWWQTVGCL
jgi:hypothetical protein